MNRWIAPCVAALVLLCAGVQVTAAPQIALDATAYQLVSTQRIDRTTFLYTYTVHIRNGGTPGTNVLGTVTSTAPATRVVDAEVRFGDVAENAVSASVDTFSFAQDRSVAFDPSQLRWTFSADDLPPQPGPFSVQLLVSAADGFAGASVLLPLNVVRSAGFNAPITIGLIVHRLPAHARPVS